MKKILLTTVVLLSVGFAASAQKTQTLVQTKAEKNSKNAEMKNKEAAKIENDKKGTTPNSAESNNLSKNEAYRKAHPKKQGKN